VKKFSQQTMPSIDLYPQDYPQADLNDGNWSLTAISRRKAMNYATILANRVDVHDSDDISQLESKRCRIPKHPKSSA
jgi:hypothetical protein